MRKGKLIASAILGAALMVSLTACGGGSSDGGSSAAGGAGVSVSLKEFAITPAEIDLPAAGGSVTVKNDGTMPHSFESADLGIKSNMLGPGDSQTIKVAAHAAGTFDSYCGVAGHKESGMEAKVVIK